MDPIRRRAARQALQLSVQFLRPCKLSIHTPYQEVPRSYSTSTRHGDQNLHKTVPFHTREVRLCRRQAHERNLHAVVQRSRRQTRNFSSRLDREGGVFIALGSNLGDRVQAIEDACHAIDDDPDMHIVRTSCLYETKPMYVEDQELFLNGVCEVSRNVYRYGYAYTDLARSAQH